MKKYLIITAVLFCITFTAQSQVNFGLKVGVNANQLTPSSADIQNNGFKYGFVGGAFFRFNLGSFYIQPEVLYAQKGANLRSTNTASLNDFERNINSLDVPILLGLTFGETAKFRVNAGPVLGFPLSAVQNGESRYRDALNSANVGYQAGIGLDLSSVTFDLRYEGGLGNVGKDTYTVGSQIFKTDDRISTFQFTIGVKLF